MRAGYFILFITSVLLISGCNDSTPSYQGYTEANLRYLSSPNSSSLKALYVHKGEFVKKGTLIATLDDMPYNAKLTGNIAKINSQKALYHDQQSGKREEFISEVEFQIEAAKAKHLYAEQQFERDKKLLADKSISQSQFDQSKSIEKETRETLSSLQSKLASLKLPARPYQISSQQENVKQAESEKEIADWTLAQLNIKAPDNGYIYDIFYWPDEQVQAYRPVVSFYIPSKMRIIFYVPEQILKSIHLGQSINYTIDNNNDTNPQHAKISYISQSAEYTPPVIYSQTTLDDLVFRIEAKPDKVGTEIHPGQPVRIFLN